MKINKKKLLKDQVELFTRAFKVGDIIMIRAKDGLGPSVLTIAGFGRIRKILDTELIIKLIIIPGRKRLMTYFPTVSYSNIHSLGIKKYWVIKKIDAIILMESNSNVARFDYKSLMTYAKLKYTKYIQKGFIEL